MILIYSSVTGSINIVMSSSRNLESRTWFAMEFCSSEVNADPFVSMRDFCTILFMHPSVIVAQLFSSIPANLSVTLTTLKTEVDRIRRSAYALHLVSDEEM